MRNNTKILVLATIQFLVNTLQFVYGGILDKVAASVGVSIATAGQLNTVYALSSAIGTPLIMMVAAKADRRKLFLMALATLLLGTLITALAPGFELLLISRFFIGLGAGVCMVTAMVIASNLAPEGALGRSLATLAMGASLALVLGVPLSRIIAAAFDWRLIFVGMAVLLAAVLAIVAKTIPASSGKSPVPLNQQLAYLMKPAVAAALSVTFLMFISYSVMNTYITPYLRLIAPAKEGQISLVLLGIGIACFIGSKMGGHLADWITPPRTLMVGMIIQTIALSALSLVSDSWVITLTLLFFWAAAAWISGPTLNINLISTVPEASGIMVSLNSSFIQLGFAAGAGLGGIVISGTSVLFISWVGAPAVVLALFVGLFAFGRKS